MGQLMECGLTHQLFFGVYLKYAGNKNAAIYGGQKKAF
jgi:hypothetical protein